ncbi:CXXC-type zinc finger protein 1 [Frankliniella fusca]|uniref:CXXC-type zinc finger protein 1 n=1 Tax=Frankliniella fusca TaxID=407009 RepID=A0AAE1HRU3_9NEOP|nr:CXXC-type zinc finger protein 1 [Frankliniella fusca]
MGDHYNYVCGKEDVGFMIFCDNCETLYHGQCVSIVKSELKVLLFNKCSSLEKNHCLPPLKILLKVHPEEVSALQNELLKVTEERNSIQVKYESLKEDENSSANEEKVSFCRRI